MCVSDVFQHVVDGPLRRVALAIVSPAARATARALDWPTGCSATEGLIAFSIGTWNSNLISVRLLFEVNVSAEGDRVEKLQQMSLSYLLRNHEIKMS